MKYLIVLCLLLTTFFVSNTFADDTEITATEAAEQTAKQEIEEYTLPYPGILPDNPLYPLKALRDRVVGFLISDPLKLAEFNLLQADKRLQSGIFLVDRNKKFELAEETISKGENYFEYAITNALDAEKQGEDVSAMQDKLRKSAAKHQKVINELAKKAPKEQQKLYQSLVKRSESIEQKVSAFGK